MWRDYTRVARVDLAGVLGSGSSRSAANTLIVGTDSREGIRGSDPNSGAFLAGAVTGSRTDTIMVLHSDGSSTTLVSIPRDLWVTDPASGAKSRINATYGSGAANLVRAVSALGIPVDHYLEIDFSGFGDMVDAVGGVDVDFTAPARDTHSGLDVPTPGRHRLGGAEALAYVRSRYYEQYIGGRWQVDGSADLGRTERQRGFLATLLHSVIASRSPITLVQLGSAAADGLVLDGSLGLLDLVEIARSLDGAAMESDVLPVTPRMTSGGAEVLELQPSARSVLDRLAT
jgi:LCP family protein required for cell wall assembly